MNCKAAAALALLTGAQAGPRVHVEGFNLYYEAARGTRFKRLLLPTRTIDRLQQGLAHLNVPFCSRSPFRFFGVPVGYAPCRPLAPVVDDVWLNTARRLHASAEERSRARRPLRFHLAAIRAPIPGHHREPVLSGVGRALPQRNRCHHLCRPTRPSSVRGTPSATGGGPKNAKTRRVEISPLSGNRCRATAFAPDTEPSARRCPILQ